MRSSPAHTIKINNKKRTPSVTLIVNVSLSLDIFLALDSDLRFLKFEREGKIYSM